MNKIIWIARSFFGFLTFVGLLFITYLIFRSEKIIIGQGRLTDLLGDVEVYDFKVWILMGSFLFLSFNLGMLVMIFLLQISNRKFDDIKIAIRNLLQGKFIPVTVEIDEQIPVIMDKQVEAPFEISTKINFNEEVFVKTTIPIDMEIPLDTTIETSVLGMGKIKIPIKANLPINLNFDFSGPVKMNVQDFNFHLNERAKVSLPPLEVPIKCSIKAKLNLDANFAQFLK